MTLSLEASRACVDQFFSAQDFFCDFQDFCLWSFFSSDMVLLDRASTTKLSFLFRYSIVKSYSSSSNRIRVSFELGFTIENKYIKNLWYDLIVKCISCILNVLVENVILPSELQLILVLKCEITSTFALPSSSDDYNQNIPRRQSYPIHLIYIIQLDIT